jgi:hypothetical protein
MSNWDYSKEHSEDPEPKWAKLMRMDFITYTNKVEHEIKMVKKELRAIKENQRILINKRPDQTTKTRLKQIIDILSEDK